MLLPCNVFVALIFDVKIDDATKGFQFSCLNIKPERTIFAKNKRKIGNTDWGVFIGIFYTARLNFLQSAYWSFCNVWVCMRVFIARWLYKLFCWSNRGQQCILHRFEVVVWKEWGEGWWEYESECRYVGRDEWTCGGNRLKISFFWSKSNLLLGNIIL